MNELTKQYFVGQQEIKVALKPQVASLDFTAYEAKHELRQLYEGCCAGLIAEIKNDYQHIYQRELNISDASFRAEIWGHLVAYKIALWLKRTFKFRLAQQLAKFAAFRSGVIDCGERKVDSNRWFWDILGLFF